MRLLAFITAFLFASVALANQVAPLLPFVSAWGWLGLPLIVLTEGLILKYFGVPTPFTLCLKANIISSLYGVPFAILNFFVPIPGLPLFPAHFGSYSPSDFQSQVVEPTTAIAVVSLILMGITSAWIEHRYASLKLKTVTLPKKPFYLANALTYAIIIGLYIFVIFQMSKKIPDNSYREIAHAI